MGVNGNHMDKLLIRLLEYMDAIKLKEDERPNFVRVVTSKSTVHPKIVEYASSCSKFESMDELKERINKTDLVVAQALNVFN